MRSSRPLAGLLALLVGAACTPPPPPALPDLGSGPVRPAPLAGDLADAGPADLGASDLGPSDAGAGDVGAVETDTGAPVAPDVGATPDAGASPVAPDLGAAPDADAVPMTADAGLAETEAELTVTASASPSAAPATPRSETATTAFTDTPGEVLGYDYLMRDLPNGLRAIAVKTPHPGILSLQIVVRTGSGSEVEEGKTGFAHFFEHMMFRGTEKYPPARAGKILELAGAEQNAYTSDDITNYHTTFTTADLDAILDIEADRFQNLAYTEEQFRTEALAVKGEYLKNHSSPFRRLHEKAHGIAFTTHPYRHTTMGFIEDIEDMPNQMAHGEKFFDRYYRPENTIVLLVGDIAPEAGVKKISDAFGEWERGSFEPSIPVEPPPAGPGYAHVQWESETQPWLLFAFRGPAFDSSSETSAALDVLSTLAFSEASPLYQKVVVDEQWADQLWSWFPSRRDPSLLYVGVRLLDGKHADAVTDTVYGALRELGEAPLEDGWVERARTRLRYETAAELDSAPAIAGTLARLLTLEGTPEAADTLMASYQRVSPEALQTVAKTYFTDQRRFVVTLSGDETMAGFDAKVSLTGTSPKTKLFGAAPESVSPPSIETSSVAATLPKLSTLPANESSLVTVSYLFSTGAAYDPPGKKGLAALTAAMIADAGTKTLSYADIQAAVYPMAASLSAQVDKEMLRFSATVHRDALEDFHAFALAQLTQPGFREEDFTRTKQQLISRISMDLVSNNDEELGKEALYAEIYADHPYGSYDLGRVADVEALTLEDVKTFYAEQLRASALTVGVAGGYPETFPQTLVEALGALPSGPHATVELPAVKTSTVRVAYVLQKPTSAVAVSLGFPIEPTRGHEDWVALWLARSWLGQHRSSKSHLYQEIRAERGMNYGDYAYVEYFPRGMFQFVPDTNLARRQQIFQIWLRPLRTNQDAHFATRLALDELETLVKDGLGEDDFQATRSYLQKTLALLMQTDARRLGYALDSEFYDIAPFDGYVRRELEAMSVEDVNAALREHLSSEGMTMVFVAEDAADMAARLEDDRPSPMKYAPPKPQLAERDAEVVAKDLEVSTSTVIPAAALF